MFKIALLYLYSFILELWKRSLGQENLAILLHRQNHASRIVYFNDKYIYAKPLMNNLIAINIYQLNIY